MSAPAPRLLRLKQVVDQTGLSRPSVYRLMAAGDFPRPIKIAERSVAWIESDIGRWIEQRLAAAGRTVEPEPDRERAVA